MEEPPFLLPVERDVPRVEVKNDLDQRTLLFFLVDPNPLVAVILVFLTQLQSAESRLARALVPVGFQPTSQRQHHIDAPDVVVDEILIPLSQTADLLAEKDLNGKPDAVGIALVLETTGQTTIRGGHGTVDARLTLR